MQKALLALVSLTIWALNLQVGLGSTYYVAPNKNLDGSTNTLGSDSNSGVSTSLPFATFDRAWQALYPGDTLFLMDGIYYQSLAPNVRDGAPNTAINTQDYLTYPLDHPERIKKYIRIRALNDGK